MESLHDAPLRFTTRAHTWATWSADDIAALEEPTLALVRIDIETIIAVPDNEKSFRNTIAAMDNAFGDVYEVVCALEFISSVHPDQEVRSCATGVSIRIRQVLIELTYDEQLYAATAAYAARNEPLEGAEKRLLDDTLTAYRRLGFELTPEKRAELQTISKKLIDLESAYDKNLVEEDGSIIVSPENMEGVPDSVRQRLARTEDADYIVTVKYPDYLPFMQYAVRGQERKRMAEAYFMRGGEVNIELLKEIVSLRQQHAQLLGYPNHIAYQTETRMARSAAAAQEFVADLGAKLRPGVLADVAKLRALKQADGLDEPLMYYDVLYYINKDQEQRFAIDDEVIRPYFPLEQVISGMFEIYQTLLGVTFVADASIPELHPAMRTFRVEDEGETIGYFIMDLHPRDGKYNHAAAFTIIQGRELEDGSYVVPVSGLVCNFTAPTDAAPSLLTHGEVETFFHEFGHIMHQTLTRAAYPSQSGTQVAQDFVEAPSQMLENWVWDPEMLAKLSAHYQTGESLPAELLEKLIGLKQHFQAYFEGRQILLGSYDLAIHGADSIPDFQRLYSELSEESTGIPFPSELMMAASFGHLVGYSAGYYSYMWSKVYAADMFTRFASEGVLNPTTGGAYRRWILEKGSSEDELDLVRGFLGREPTKEAFLKELGLEA